jgi:hypothetical protein
MGSISLDIQEKRFEICKTCTNFTEKEFCSLCGCHMPLKVQKDYFSCPIDKW